MSHYIPYFTTESGRKRRTACGVYVEFREHTAEPQCPVCLAWLQAETAREAEDDAAVAALQAMPANPPSPKPPTFDILDGYTLRSRR